MDRQTALSILSKVREKQASRPSKQANWVDPVAANEAMRRVVSAGLTSAGLGAGVAGLQGLYQLLEKNLKKPRKSTRRTEIVPMPFVQMPDDSETDESQPPVKAAGWLDVNRYWAIPWFLPMFGAATTGGVFTGYKGVQKLLSQQRKKEVSEDLEQARDEFRKALSERPIDKVASDDVMVKVGQDLDTLYDLWEKKSFIGNLGGALLGTLGLYGLGSGLVGLHHGLEEGEARQKKTALKEALKRRMFRRQQQQPAALFAVPGDSDRGIANYVWASPDQE